MLVGGLKPFYHESTAEQNREMQDLEQTQIDALVQLCSNLDLRSKPDLLQILGATTALLLMPKTEN